MSQSLKKLEEIKKLKEFKLNKQLESLKFYDIKLSLFFKKDNKFNLPHNKPIKLFNISKENIRINSIHHLLNSDNYKIFIPILNDKTNIIVLDNLLFENKKILESITEETRNNSKFNPVQLFIKNDTDTNFQDNINKIFKTILGVIFDSENIGNRALRDNIPLNDKNIIDIISKSNKSKMYIEYVTKSTKDNTPDTIYKSSIYLNIFNILSMYFNDTNSYISHDNKWYKFNKINPMKYNDENILTFNIVNEKEIHVSFEIDNIEELLPKFDIKYTIENLKDIDRDYREKLKNITSNNDKVKIPIFNLTIKNLSEKKTEGNLYIDYFTHINELESFNIQKFTEIFEYNKITNIKDIDIFTDEKIFNLYSLISTNNSRNKYFKIIDNEYKENSLSYKKIIKDIKTELNKLQNRLHNTDLEEKIKTFLKKIIFKKNNIFIYKDNKYYIDNLSDNIIIERLFQKENDYINDILINYKIKLNIILNKSYGEIILKNKIYNKLDQFDNFKKSIKKKYNCNNQSKIYDRKLLDYYNMLGIDYNFLNKLINKKQKGGKTKKNKTRKSKSSKYRITKNN
jgi:hypothetical protein